MAEAIGLLNNLPVKIEDNVLQVGSSPDAPLNVTSDAASPLSVTTERIYERVTVEFTYAVGSYDAGMVIGGLLTFPFSKAGWEQLILYVYDDLGDVPNLDVYFFSEQPAAFADGDPFVPNAADTQKVMSVVSSQAFVPVGAGGVMIVPLVVGLVTHTPLIGDTLYVYLTMNQAYIMLQAGGLGAAVLAKS